MINFLKKLFRRRNKEEEPEDSTLKTFEEFVSYSDSLDETKFGKANELFSQISDNKVRKVFKDLLNISKSNRSEKIVNQYGADLHKASEDNKIVIKEFFQNAKSGKLDRAGLTNKLKYQLMNKMDIKYLSNSKSEIKEAIEYWLKDEKDAEAADQLKAGLLFLEDFIDFDKVE